MGRGVRASTSVACIRQKGWRDARREDGARTLLQTTTSRIATESVSEETVDATYRGLAKVIPGATNAKIKRGSRDLGRADQRRTSYIGSREQGRAGARGSRQQDRRRPTLLPE